MSTGKYSPLCPHSDEPGYDMFKFNCYGEVPTEWNKDSYDEKTMYDNYDDEGFDSYGYSCFDADGEYVGGGNGVDRYGYTEMDYLTGGDLYYDIQSYGGPCMTSFVRNR